MLLAPRFTFHHLGLACRSIDIELQAWSRLGYDLEGERFVDPIQKVRGLFVTGAGPRLELLEPAGEGSPLNGYLSRGVKIYHQAFLVADFDPALEDIAKAGGKLVSPPAPAVAFGGRRVAFVMLPGLNLIEIVEAEV